MHNQIIERVERWINKNLPVILRDARLTGKLVQWGGLFQYGNKVPVGTAVLYINKIFVAVSDDQSDIPREDGDGFAFLVDLSNMRYWDAEWLSKTLRVPESSASFESRLASNLINRALDKIVVRALGEAQTGRFRWRGVYQAGGAYQTQDLVAYNRGLYAAITGDGTPGAIPGAWNLLDRYQGGTGLTDPGIGEVPTPPITLEDSFYAATYHDPNPPPIADPGFITAEWTAAADYEAVLHAVGPELATTTHAVPMWALDHEGVAQRYPVNAPVWKGARVVLAGGAGTDVVEAYADDGAGVMLDPQPFLVADGFSDEAQLVPQVSVNAYPAGNHSNTKGPYIGEIDFSGGDTKVLGEFLSIEPALGPQLVSGGTFTGNDGDPVDPIWAGSATIDNNRMKVSELSVTADISVTIGNSYRIRVTKEAGTVSGTVRCGDVDNSIRYINTTADGINDLIIVAVSDHIRYQLFSTASETVFYDDVSVEEISATDKQLTLTDGTNSVSLPITPGVRKYGVAMDATAGTMSLNLNGVYSADTTYDGTLPIGATLDLGVDSREVKRFDDATLAEQKAKIDEELVVVTYNGTDVTHNSALVTHTIGT